MTRIVLQLIDEIDLKLLERCAEEFGIDVAAVRRFPRFGRSGSNLYRLQHLDHSDVVFVVKLGALLDIRDETKRTKQSRWWTLETAEAVEAVEDPSAGRAALCVQYKADGDDVLELDDLYRDALKGDSDSLDRLMSALEATYGMLAQRAHHPAEPGPTPTYEDLFERYQRTKVTDRATQLFESAGSLPVTLPRTTVADNPLVHIPGLMARHCEPLRAKFVHGDLHPSNVVMRARDPALVDFAWSNKDDHICKDFVMMESAFRFMRFPRTVHPVILEDVDRALNQNWACDLAREYVLRLPTCDGKVALNCAVRAVESVRASATTVLRRFDVEEKAWQREYFLALYLVLAGQQRFDTFPLLRVIGNLHDLAETYVP